MAQFNLLRKFGVAVVLVVSVTSMVSQASSAESIEFVDLPAGMSTLATAARLGGASDAPTVATPTSGSTTGVTVPAETMPIGDLPGWDQIFTDDFTTNVPLGSFPAAVSSKWGAYPSPWRDTSGYGIYSPAKVVSVANGVLDKHIRTEDGVPMVAALTPKLSSAGSPYGRYAVRFRSDALTDYKVAWMLWPESNDHIADGEIDFPETNLDKQSVWAFMHRTNAVGNDQAAYTRSVSLSDWHTAVIEWSPNLVVFDLDGVEIGRTSERVPTTPMRWVLQTETILGLNQPPAISSNGHVQIDWVAAWAYDPSTADVTGPAVSITSPAPSAVVSGSAVNISATATDAGLVSGVQFKIDGVALGAEDTVAPYAATWNTLLAANGAHVLTAVGRDDSNNVRTSAPVSITVNNVADVTAPTFKPTPCQYGCTVFPQSGGVVLATFDEAVTGVNATTFTLKNKTTGEPVPAVVTYTASATSSVATLTPSVTLLADGKYTATVSAGVKDTAGNAVVPFAWSFVTGPRPTVAVTPSANTTGVGRGTNIVATFNEAVSGVSTSTMTVKTSAGVIVPAAVSYNPTTFVATLDPTATLAANTKYTVTLNANIKDVVFNAINTLTFTFTTGT